jgi:spore coat protein U-like protein
LGLFAASIAFAGYAWSANPVTFNVQATVRANCAITATDLNFGDYLPSAGDVSVQSSLSVRCTNGTPYTVSLNAGSTTGGSITQRLMANGANRLQYNLYTDAARTTVWGDGTTGSRPAGTGSGLQPARAVDYPVYGLLPDSATNQDAPVGVYADVVTATVVF